MAANRGLIIVNGRVKQADPTPTTGDTIYIGTIDQESANALNIGTTTATSINIGRTGQLTTIQGNLQVDGTQTVVGNTTFQEDVVLGDAREDIISFNGAIGTPSVAPTDINIPLAENVGGVRKIAALVAASISGTGTGVTIEAAAGLGTNQDGGNVHLQGGAPTGTGSYGDITFGDSAAAGAAESYQILVDTGTAGEAGLRYNDNTNIWEYRQNSGSWTSFTSGTVPSSTDQYTFLTGDGSTGWTETSDLVMSNSGARTVGVETSAAGAGVNLTVESGDAFATGGGAGGILVLQGGLSDGTGTTGAPVLRSQDAPSTGATGQVSIYSGDTSTGTSGDISIGSGSASGAGTSGDVLIAAGTVSGGTDGSTRIYRNVDFENGIGGTYAVVDTNSNSLTNAAGGYAGGTRFTDADNFGMVWEYRSEGYRVTMEDASSAAGGRMYFDAGAGNGAGNAGGEVSLRGGFGGSGGATGAAGGAVSILGRVGSTGTADGGAGGAVSITAGDGGDGGTGAAGAGASVTITAGDAATTGTAAAGGNISLVTGTPQLTGTNGYLLYGPSAAEASNDAYIIYANTTTGATQAGLRYNHTASEQWEIRSDNGTWAAIATGGSVPVSTDQYTYLQGDASGGWVEASDVTLPNSGNRTITIEQSATGVIGRSLIMQAGNALDTNLNGGALYLQAGQRHGTGDDGNIVVGEGTYGPYNGIVYVGKQDGTITLEVNCDTSNMYLASNGSTSLSKAVDFGSTAYGAATIDFLAHADTRVASNVTFDGDANYTISQDTPTASGAGATLAIQSGTANTTGVGGALNLVAGNGAGAAANGGALSIVAGNSGTSGTGGSTRISGGTGTVANGDVVLGYQNTNEVTFGTGNAVNINFLGHASNVVTSNINFSAADYSIQLATNTSAAGDDLTVKAGTSTNAGSAGGILRLYTGAPGAGGTPGSIVFGAPANSDVADAYQFLANTDGSPQAGLRYNNSTNAWQIRADGGSWADIGSGGSVPVSTDQYTHLEGDGSGGWTENTTGLTLPDTATARINVETRAAAGNGRQLLLRGGAGLTAGQGGGVDLEATAGVGAGDQGGDHAITGGAAGDGGAAGAVINVYGGGANGGICLVTGGAGTDATANGGDVRISAGASTSATDGDVYVGFADTENVYIGQGSTNVAQWDHTDLTLKFAGTATIDLPDGADANPFKLGGTAVSAANITAANFDRLFDGTVITEAMALHTHENAGGFTGATTAEAITASAPVGVENNGGTCNMYEADASAAGNRKYCIGFAAAAIGSGSTGTILNSGEITVADAEWTDVTKPAAAQSGLPVWLSETAGQVTYTPPTTVGSVLQKLGFISFADGSADTRISINIGDPVDL